MNSASPQSRYRCRRCGNCCRWEGYVRLTSEEVERIAAFFDLSVEEFTAQYTELTDDRRSLTLREQPNGHCIFFEDATNSCVIYDIRPQQCRDFPNKWNFPGFRTMCEAELK